MILLYIINLTLLGFSISMMLILSVIRLQKSFFFDKLFMITLISNPIIGISLLVSLYFFRFMCSIKQRIFDIFVLTNVIIIVVFLVGRCLLLTTMLPFSEVTLYIFFSVSFCFSAVFAALRILFHVGYTLNDLLIKEPHIQYILENFLKGTGGIFINLGKKLAGEMPPNPKNAVDRSWQLTKGTFVANCITAGATVFAGYIGYELLQLSKQTAATGERSADIAERTLDIQERNSGKMSPEVYDQKWDQYGHKRKKD